MSASKAEPSTEPRGERFGASPDRLNSWKEVALYLKRQVRTVQHWEKHEGLPVHRHFHRKQGSIFAFRSEIEAWGKRRASDQTRDSRISVEAAPKSHPVQIAIMAFSNELTDGPLARLLSETARLLETAQIKVQSDQEAQAADFIVRWKPTIEADCCTAELFSTKRQTVIWSREFGPDTCASALVRSVALLVRSAAIPSIWDTSTQSVGMGRRGLPHLFPS